MNISNRFKIVGNIVKPVQAGDGDGVEVATIKDKEMRRLGVAMQTEIDGQSLTLIMSGRDAISIASALQAAAYAAGEN